MAQDRHGPEQLVFAPLGPLLTWTAHPLPAWHTWGQAHCTRLSLPLTNSSLNLFPASLPNDSLEWSIFWWWSLKRRFFVLCCSCFWFLCVNCLFLLLFLVVIVFWCVRTCMRMCVCTYCGILTSLHRLWSFVLDPRHKRLKRMFI